MADSKIPATMRAAVLEEFNQPYQLKQVDTPPGPDGHDLLIQVLAASYCHTDAVLASGAMSKELPRVGCHEFAGRIMAMGPQVSSNLNLSVGDEVGVPGRAYHPCGSCYECNLQSGDPEGYSPYCPHAKNLGLTMDGGFRDYAIVDSRQVAPIPQGMTALETAPLMCAGLTIWTALQRVQDANTIAIIGAGGGLGHIGVQFAAHLGKKIVAIDAAETALRTLITVVAKLKKSHAANEITVVDSRVSDPTAILRTIGEAGAPSGENGVDAVILLPEAQAAFDTGMALLRNHGTMVVVSFPEKFTFSAKDLVFRDIKVIGSLVGRNYQLRQMLEFAAAHEIRAQSQIFSLDQLNDLVNEYHSKCGGKLIIDMQASRSAV